MMTPTNSAGQLCDMNSAKVGALRGWSQITRYRRLMCSGLTWCFYLDLRKQMWECDLFDGGCVNRFLRRWSEGVFFW